MRQTNRPTAYKRCFRYCAIVYKRRLHRYSVH